MALLLLSCPLDLLSPKALLAQTKSSYRVSYQTQTQSKPKRAAEFFIPAKLKPRVDFWIDIFATYGKHQFVIHHRNFPQAVFDVVDLRTEGQVLSELKFDILRKKETEARIKEVEAVLRRLGTGTKPRNPFEERVAGAMEKVPGSRAKFKEAVSEGLVRSQRGIRERYAEAVSRSGRYMHILEDIFVREFSLPIELTRLPFVESSFDYKAYSSVGAAGIWQFMPATAKSYMRVDNIIDERRDVVSATRGAAKYLRYAYKTLQKWPLAITSYNHGIGGVRKRVKKAGTSDLIAMIEHPRERYMGFASSNFYPEFLAALEVYDNLQKYFPEVRPEAPKQIALRKLTHPTSVHYVVQQLGISEEEIQETNYAISERIMKGVYPIPKNYVLKVPIRYEAKLRAMKLPEPRRRESTPGASSVTGGIVYQVRRGDTLSAIARRYRTSISHLKQLNGLRSDTVYVGQRLLVEQRTQRTPVPAAERPGEYVVRSGDTLSGIAQKYGLSISELKRMNGLSGTNIRVGQKLKLSRARTSSSRPETAAGSSSTYTVQRGDSLGLIAKRFGTSVSALKAANGLRSNLIHKGQKLQLPTSGARSTVRRSQIHIVQAGESLWSIAKRYGVSISALKSKNGLRSSSIRRGQRLTIP